MMMLLAGLVGAR